MYVLDKLFLTKYVHVFRKKTRNTIRPLPFRILDLPTSLPNDFVLKFSWCSIPFTMPRNKLLCAKYWGA